MAEDKTQSFSFYELKHNLNDLTDISLLSLSIRDNPYFTEKEIFRK